MAAACGRLWAGLDAGAQRACWLLAHEAREAQAPGEVERLQLRGLAVGARRTPRVLVQVQPVGNDRMARPPAGPSAKGPAATAPEPYPARSGADNNLVLAQRALAVPGNGQAVQFRKPAFVPALLANFDQQFLEQGDVILPTANRRDMNASAGRSQAPAQAAAVAGQHLVQSLFAGREASQFCQKGRNAWFLHGFLKALTNDQRQQLAYTSISLFTPKAKSANIFPIKLARCRRSTIPPLGSPEHPAM